MISTPDLCDEHGDAVQVAAPVFRHYGAIVNFGGQVATIKCHEDNSLVAEAVKSPGKGRILVVDGGGSVRRSLLGDNLAAKAVENGWSGILIFGALRDVEEIAPMQLGVLALASIPRKTQKRGEGQTGVSLNFAGITINDGDYLYADLTGVIVSTVRLTTRTAG